MFGLKLCYKLAIISTMAMLYHIPSVVYANEMRQATQYPVEPVQLVGTQQIILKNSLGEPYRILLSQPLHTIQPTQPVIIVLDGDTLFPTGLRTLLLHKAKSKTPNTDPVLIGIGYPDTALFNKRRTMDYSDPQGMMIFSDFLTQIVFKQTLGQILSPHQPSITLVGHSLGGLFALSQLAKCQQGQACPYQHLVIASPSLWWDNERYLHNLQRDFKVKHSPKSLPKVSISVGALENTPSQHMDKMREKLLNQRNMVENSRILSQQLTTLGITNTWRAFEGQRHHAAAEMAVNLAIESAFTELQD